MTGVVDVGDALELTFSSATGANVEVSWLDPNQDAVIDQAPVTESPPGSGSYPFTFLPTSPGVWTALFTSTGTGTAVERYYVRASAVTGPPPLATVGDISGQFGTLTSVQEGLASWLLRAASSLVRSRYQVDALIAAGRLDPEVVALGVANMVLRVMRNSGGLRSETVGPFSRTYDTTYAAGLLVITPGEELMFSPAPVLAAGEPVGVATMRPGLLPPAGGRRGWCW